VLLAEVVEVRPAHLEDPQAQQAEQAHQGEVIRVGRVASRSEQRLQLKMGQAEGG
jgi:hypothetical protein